MNALFEKNYVLRTSDFDVYGRIKPAALMDLFQDVAGMHAEELGCGYDALLNKQMLWVLVRNKLEIISSPKIFQSVNVKTWPLMPSRAGFQREYLIEDVDGNVLVKGSSDWVVIHSEKRRFMQARDIYPVDFAFLEKQNFPEKLSKIHDFELSGEMYTVKPGFSDIDRNNHVNNTRYASFVLDALVPTNEDKIKTVQIDYRREVVRGSELSIGYVRNGQTLLAKGLNPEGDTMFVCKIDFYE